jgi:6,7-dimethyl-8-ribityllumazine synthase
MATVNLSNGTFFDIDEVEKIQVAIVVAKWNTEITEALYNGAKETLLRFGFKPENIHKHYVPGSFELALGAKWLAGQSKIQGVICLGCIIRGETPHFEFVSMATAQGIQDVALQSQKPIVFGVLTDDHIQQSMDRSGGEKGNKGVEAAFTLAEMIHLKKSLHS